MSNYSQYLQFLQHTDDHTLEKMSERYQKQIKDLKQEISLENKARKKDIANLERESDSAAAILQNSWTEKFNILKKKHQDKLRSQRNDFNKKKEDLQYEYDNEIRLLQKEIDNYKLKHTKKQHRKKILKLFLFIFLCINLCIIVYLIYINCYY